MAKPIILPFNPSFDTLNGVFTAADLINQGTTGVTTFTDIYNAALTHWRSLDKSAHG